MNNITYQKMIVSYIDILGFKDWIEREKKNPLKINTMLDIFDIVQFLSEEDSCSPFIFSDSMVRLVKFNNEIEFFNNFISEIKHLAYAQLTVFCEHDLVGHHFLLRGGITVGDIYYDESKYRIFGPAFNKSYELESKRAIFPRIIIDPEIYDKYLKGKITNSSDYLVSVDSENMPYIDYLKQAVNKFTTHKEFIMKHASIIRNKIKEYENESNKNEPALNKYCWLREYHNDTLKMELPKILKCQIGNYLV